MTAFKEPTILNPLQIRLLELGKCIYCKTKSLNTFNVTAKETKKPTTEVPSVTVRQCSNCRSVFVLDIDNPEYFNKEQDELITPDLTEALNNDYE